MQRLGMMMIVGSLVAASGLAQGEDSRRTSRESAVSFRLATTVATADFDRLAYNGEVLYVANSSTFSSGEIRTADSIDAGGALELMLTREAASDLESATRRAETDRLAVFVGSRIVAAPTIEVNDTNGATVLGGFSSGVVDRLIALLSREGVAYGGPVLSVSSDVTAARAGDVITVDAFVVGVSDLGAFQATLKVTGGTTGQIVIEDVQIDDTRFDYVFDPSAVKVTDQDQFRAAGVLMNGGVSAEEPAYVATYTLRVSPDASGTFNINVLTGEGSLLRDSNAMAIAYRPGQDLAIAVGKSRTERPTR